MNERTLKKELFTIEDISQTISAFSSLCKITIEEKDTEYICRIESSDYDEIETFNEFENYLIDLSNRNCYKT